MQREWIPAIPLKEASYFAFDICTNIILLNEFSKILQHTPASFKVISRSTKCRSNFMKCIHKIIHSDLNAFLIQRLREVIHTNLTVQSIRNCAFDNTFQFCSTVVLGSCSFIQMSRCYFKCFTWLIMSQNWYILTSRNMRQQKLSAFACRKGGISDIPSSSRLTSGERKELCFIIFVCIWRIWKRPFSSGRFISMCTSNLPGLNAKYHKAWGTVGH